MSRLSSCWPTLQASPRLMCTDRLTHVIPYFKTCGECHSFWAWGPNLQTLQEGIQRSTSLDPIPFTNFIYHYTSRWHEPSSQFHKYILYGPFSWPPYMLSDYFCNAWPHFCLYLLRPMVTHGQRQLWGGEGLNVGGGGWVGQRRVRVGNGDNCN